MIVAHTAGRRAWETGILLRCGDQAGHDVKYVRRRDDLWQKLMKPCWADVTAAHTSLPLRILALLYVLALLDRPPPASRRSS